MTHTPLPAVSSQWIQQLVVCLVHEKLVVCLVHEKLVVCLVHEKLVIHTVMMKIPVKNVQADRRQIINPPRAVEKQSKFPSGDERHAAEMKPPPAGQMKPPPAGQMKPPPAGQMLLLPVGLQR